MYSFLLLQKSTIAEDLWDHSSYRFQSIWNKYTRSRFNYAAHHSQHCALSTVLCNRSKNSINTALQICNAFSQVQLMFLSYWKALSCLIFPTRNWPKGHSSGITALTDILLLFRQEISQAHAPHSNSPAPVN